MLDPGELEQIRDDILAMMPDACNIITVTYTPDGYGGTVPTLGTVGANIPCRMDAKTGSEILTGGAIQTYQGNTLTLPWDASCDTKNRIEYKGNVYAVISVSEGSWLSCLRVTVERI
jgi:hypothetical protein